MKHTVRIFEVSKAGQTDPPPQEHESLQLEAANTSLARDKARHELIEAGWQIRAISHAVDGGLLAYVVKPEKPARRRRSSHREGRRAKS